MVFWAWHESLSSFLHIQSKLLSLGQSPLYRNRIEYQTEFASRTRLICWASCFHCCFYRNQMLFSWFAIVYLSTSFPKKLPIPVMFRIVCHDITGTSIPFERLKIDHHEHWLTMWFIIVSVLLRVSLKICSLVISVHKIHLHMHSTCSLESTLFFAASSHVVGCRYALLVLLYARYKITIYKPLEFL